MQRHVLAIVSTLAAAIAVPACDRAAAQSLGGGIVGGKGATMVIGFGPGGGYDLWGRLVARSIGKYLQGAPPVIIQNMPGAGSYVAASYMANLAPKDGTTFAIIARDATLGPLTGADGARFDPLKMGWLGTPTTETNVCIANAAAKVKSYDDLLKSELIIGDTGPGTGTYSYPLALNALVGTKFKLIHGFPSSSDVFLAMERGEVDGMCESLDSVSGKRPDWIPQKKINILFQAGAEKNASIPDVPYILDLVRADETKADLKFLYAGQGIGRPFVAPPGMAADKLKTLRSAFDKTMKDADFVADAKKQKLYLDPRDGDYLAKLIADIYATPKPIIDKIGKLIQ